MLLVSLVSVLLLVTVVSVFDACIAIIVDDDGSIPLSSDDRLSMSSKTTHALQLSIWNLNRLDENNSLLFGFGHIGYSNVQNPQII